MLLMTEIYSMATSVLMWLGEACPDTEAGINFLLKSGNHLQAGLARVRACVRRAYTAPHLGAPLAPLHRRHI